MLFQSRSFKSVSLFILNTVVMNVVLILNTVVMSVFFYFEYSCLSFLFWMSNKEMRNDYRYRVEPSGTTGNGFSENEEQRKIVNKRSPANLESLTITYVLLLLNSSIKCFFYRIDFCICNTYFYTITYS
jgi:hypothetical protein